ncbi:TPA: hypothetical protein SMO61_000177 [Proteus mirabilis]|jgi:hypothetical protein|uniref:hypothetical protein n=1 Tax=Proteus mirabilis TaxID=584 RepID=UPI001073EA83|nr:hypothetical protein [Proteus mirabilis]MBF0799583.1 hypothetical protein [Proteus mirabilis]MBG2752088.1 hypothetical protein [Proteus mirabilis]MCW4518929.1 hypothetical protein [Proteus mirabilis]MDM3725583.1 hypothetical protein [Proteus mirabilis]MDM3829650.1 hypothetical protein [Proteus mirabilis]
MALLDTFVQVFEFDTRQADDAFNRVSKSTDDIIAEMKKAQQSATMGADGFTQFIQNLSAQLTELSSNSVDIHVNSDTSGIADSLIAEIDRIKESATDNSQSVNDFIQSVIASIEQLSAGEAINIEVEAGDTQEKIASVTAKIDELKSSINLLDIQRNELSQGVNESRVSSETLNAQYQQMQDELSLLNNELVSLTDAEKKNREGKEVIDAIVTALNADYTQFIETMRTKGIKTAIDEAKAQEHLQKELSETGSKYQEAGSSVAGFATKALGAVGIVMSIGTIFAESVSRSQEIETLDKLGKQIGVATADVDAFSGAIAELGGSRESAQADLSAMAKSFGNTKDSMEKVLQTADKVQGMSFDKAKKTLEGMGVSDEKTIELMMKGRKELERTMGIQKEYSGISKESIESSIKFNSAMAKFQQSSGLLKNSFLEMVIPALSKGLEWLTKLVTFCKENKHLVVGFFTAVATILLGKYIYAMKLASISTWTTLFPIIAIIAVIALLAAAFAIVYDDIMNFIDGNDSMIGRILEKYPRLKVVILALWETFKKLFEYLKAIVGVVADIVVAGWDLMASGLKAYVKYLLSCISVIAGWGKSFAGVFNTVSDAVVSAFEWMWEQVEKIIGWVNTGLNAVKNGWKSAKEFFGFGDDEEITVNQNVERNVNDNGEIEYAMPQEESQTENQPPVRHSIAQANAQLDAIANNAMNPITSQAISNQSNVKNESNVSIGEIKVETQATDAQGMVSGVKDALQDQLADFNQQNSTGVAK